MATSEQENGATPLLVLIPGLLSDAIVWQAVAEDLSDLCRVEIADVRQGDTMEEMADRVLAAHGGPLLAAGHSMGGRVALEMVRTAPERIVKLGLIDTGVHPRTEGEEAKRQVMIDLAWNEGMDALAARWLPPMVHPDRVDDPSLMKPLTDMVLRFDPETHERQMRALLARPDAAPLLGEFACQVLVVVGREDQWSPVAQHEVIAAGLDDARLVVIEHAGHFAPFETPAAMASALRDWINGW